MKRLLCLILTLVLTVGMFGGLDVTAAEGDVFMLYDAEGDAGNGFQDPWGQGAGCDIYYYTQGESGYGVQSFYNGIYLFQNTVTYLGYAPDISGYDYVEFDIMSYYDMVCTLELSVVRNVSAHHGSDYEMYDVYLPAETFVHVKMPIKDFVTRSVDNLDRWDSENNFDKNDTAHFSGYALDHVERIRFQLSYCTTLDGVECDDVYVVFDNVTATKNGATHTHGGSQPEVKDIQYFADVDFDQMAADVVIAIIDALTGEDQSAVWEARQAFDELTPAQQALVTNIAKLEELEAVEVEYDYGNVDGLGIVNAADALMVLKAVVGTVTLTDEQIILADVDGNSKVQATDALLILKKVVNVIDKFPVEDVA